MANKEDTTMTGVEMAEIKVEEPTDSKPEEGKPSLVDDQDFGLVPQYNIEKDAREANLFLAASLIGSFVTALFSIFTIVSSSLLTFTFNGVDCNMGFSKFCTNAQCARICPSDTDAGWQTTFTLVCFALLFSLYAFCLGLYDDHMKVWTHRRDTFLCLILSSACALLSIVSNTASQFDNATFDNFPDTAFGSGWWNLFVSGLVSFLTATFMCFGTAPYAAAQGYTKYGIFLGCLTVVLIIWASLFGFGGCAPEEESTFWAESSSATSFTWHDLFEPIMIRLENDGETPCPENSNGANTFEGCECNPGYLGSVATFAELPYYTSTCLAVSCPEYSTGTSIELGCVCDDGYPGDMTPTTESPYVVSECAAASCGALVIADSDQADGTTSGVTGDEVTVTCDSTTTQTATCDATGADTSAWTFIAC